MKKEGVPRISLILTTKKECVPRISLNLKTKKEDVPRVSGQTSVIISQKAQKAGDTFFSVLGEKVSPPIIFQINLSATLFAWQNRSR